MKQQHHVSPTGLDLRPPEQVMRLSRLGAMHQCRLSFMRVLLRRLAAENWSITRPVWNIDANGVGHAVYEAKGPRNTYSLIAYAHDLPPEMRSDRVIATAWDATFALFDGVPAADDIARLERNVPKQEAGRISRSELVLARANRSVRLFDHIRSCLASGRQPDAAELDAVGYLMRTTAVYGSGKFGAADREAICARPELMGPYQVEMLAVYLIRLFTLDIVEHLARCDAPDTAVPLAPDLRERLGVGNSTGLGMAPFLINHPVLVNNWIAARETAIARVRALPSSSAAEIAVFQDRLARARHAASLWHTDHPHQASAIEGLRADYAKLTAHVERGALTTTHPWEALWQWASASLTLEGQEAVCSLMLEPYGDLVDDLAGTMSADEQQHFPIDGTMTVAALRDLIRTIYDFAADTDFSAYENRARIWYTSQEKLEPRLGERSEPLIADYEQPLGTARDAMALLQDLDGIPENQPVAAFLIRHPEHRHAVRRIQIVRKFPYAEIRDNTVSASLLPIDLLRCKLSFFGATDFDPRSDRWIRICMYRGAPTPDRLTKSTAEDWVYPRLDP
jgi:hypothetical protein